MKYVLMAIAIMVAPLLIHAQATPAEKNELRKDIEKEHAQHRAAARDLLTGRPKAAKAHHRAAAAYHRKAHRDAAAIRERDIERAKRRHGQ